MSRDNHACARGERSHRVTASCEEGVTLLGRKFRRRSSPTANESCAPCRFIRNSSAHRSPLSTVAAAHFKPVSASFLLALRDHSSSGACAAESRHLPEIHALARCWCNFGTRRRTAAPVLHAHRLVSRRLKKAAHRRGPTHTDSHVEWCAEPGGRIGGRRKGRGEWSGNEGGKKQKQTGRMRDAPEEVSRWESEMQKEKQRQVSNTELLVKLFFKNLPGHNTKVMSPGPQRSMLAIVCVA
ncbi:hypothetical protein DFH06DRAFT_1407212 [Mycena polygramma]|nr:hypothetical protein DFH06DRAFT_1407212 [Mycena polygramma]